MSVLAIIPARGGSKRIPRKNIRPFCGKPIMAYSIEAALQSRCFDEVMVSTDDEEIASVARSVGAVVPFLRSSSASNDHAGLEDVILEVISAYGRLNRSFDDLCCILSTAPFVTAAMLAGGFAHLGSSGHDCIVPVVRYSYPIQRALHVEGSGRLSMIWPEHRDARSQDLEPSFHDAGLFYWIHVNAFLEHRQLFLPNCGSIELPESVVQDIDTEADWRMAELKFGLLVKTDSLQ
jgi:pseudaminic acid cytidylyltransferase